MQWPRSEAEWDKFGLFALRAWVLLSFAALELTKTRWYDHTGRPAFIGFFLASYVASLLIFVMLAISAFYQHKPGRGAEHLAFALLTFLIARHSLQYLAVA